MKKQKKHADEQDITCSCCGNVIDGLPALTFPAPSYWQEEFADESDCDLSSDFCVIEAKHYFIRTVLIVPIQDSDLTLEWGVWVSLSKENFKRYLKAYGTKKELKEEPYFGWSANQIPVYPDCLRIKTTVHLQGGGLRPQLELDHEDAHPLCQEQHAGITLERAHMLVKELL